MAEFSYDDAVADADVVSAIVAQMSDTPKPSEGELEQRRIEHERFLEESRRRDEEQRAAYRVKQAEAAEVERSRIEREAAIARAQARDKLQAEMAERNRSYNRDRSLTAIFFYYQIEQRNYRNSFSRSADGGIAAAFE